MALDSKDLNFIKDVVFRNGHEVAGTIARTSAYIERYGEQLEARLFRRLQILEDRFSLAADVTDVQNELRNPAED